MIQVLRSLRACFKISRRPAARDFGRGPGGLGRAQRPQRAVRNEPTPATGKRPAARTVFGQKAVCLRPARECLRSCSVVAAPSSSLVAPSGLLLENRPPANFKTGSQALGYSFHPFSISPHPTRATEIEARPR